MYKNNENILLICKASKKLKHVFTIIAKRDVNINCIKFVNSQILTIKYELLPKVINYFLNLSL